jgi:hypothetical protein
MFGKSPSINLVRAYVSPLSGHASVVLGELMENLFAGRAESVSKVSINHDTERELSARGELIGPIRYSELECAMALNKLGEVVFSLSKQLQGSVGADATPVFELTLVRPEDRSFVEEIKILAGLKEFLSHFPDTSVP